MFLCTVLPLKEPHEGQNIYECWSPADEPVAKKTGNGGDVSVRKVRSRESEKRV